MQKKEKVVKKNTDINKEKIIESKKIIALEKKKIKKEKSNIRNKRLAKFKKTKLGKICFCLSSDKINYSFSNVFWITIASLVVGAFACFCFFGILFGGRNYFKLAKQLGKFYDVYDLIVTNYYGDIDKDELIESAINGMVSSVGDVYTSYGDAEDAKAFNDLVDGTYEGIGCTITMNEEKMEVISVFDNSPASKAGLKEHDIIVKVDDKDVTELGTEGVADYIKNGDNSEIKLVIIRDEEEKTLTLKRAKIELPIVTSKVYEENGKKIGYIYIEIFSSTSTKQFKTELDKLEKNNISGLVIDVRGNNGGYLTSVTDILSYLMPKGSILYQTEVNSKKTITKDKTKDYKEYPIAVLTNGGSASASEILAAAIKESYHGYVVGTKTYGKGTVQQLKKLSDGSIIKYTTQNWLTPNGNWINEAGVEPTDLVELDNAYFENPSTDTDNQLHKALDLVSK